MTIPSEPDYLKLTRAIYTVGGASPTAPTGWELISFQPSTPNGMQAAAFRRITTDNSGEVVIAYEGTNMANAGANQALLNAQLAADAQIMVGHTPDANLDALAFAVTVAGLGLVGNPPIYVTGHSLGGEEAGYVQARADQTGVVTISGGASFGAPAVTDMAVANTNTKFKSYLSWGDTLIGGWKLPGSSSDTVGQVVHVGSLADALLQQTLSTYGGNPGKAAALGLAINSHLLSSYESAFGVTPASSVEYGTAEILELPSVFGSTVFSGTGSGNAVYAGNKLVVNNGSLDVSVSGVSTVTLNNGLSVALLTGSNRFVNAGSLGVSAVANAGTNNTITADNTQVVLANGTSSTIIGTGSTKVTLGGNNTVTLSGGKITVDTAGANTITLAAGTTATINGEGNTINGGVGSVAIINLANGSSIVKGFDPVQVAIQVSGAYYAYDGYNYYGGIDGNGVLIDKYGAVKSLANFSDGVRQFRSSFQSYAELPSPSQIVQQTSYYSGANGTGTLQSYDPTTQSVDLSATAIAELVDGEVDYDVVGNPIITASAANVAANIDALHAIDYALGSTETIVLSDSGTPTLAFNEEQALYRMGVLGKISGAYNETVSNVRVANATFIAANTRVTSLSVNDSAFSVVGHLTALQTLASGTKLSSITLTDTAPVPLALTAAQFAASSAVISKINGTINTAVSGVAAANAAAVAADTHVASITVSDSAANVVANLASLQTLAAGTKLSAITLTDTTTPTLALTLAQFNADATALGRITSAFNLNVAGTLIDSSSVSQVIGHNAVGVGTNFTGNAGKNLFERSSTGQLVAREFNSSGQSVAASSLTNANGSAFTIDTSSTVAGTGVNFWGAGYHNVFIRNGSAQLSAFEFNGSQYYFGAALTYSNGSAFTIDSSTTVIGTGINFWGAGYHDVFTRSGSGQLIANAFNGSAQLNFNGALVNADNSAFTVEAQSYVIGTGINFWGSGNHDVFLRKANGQLAAYEFDGNGKLIFGVGLTNTDDSAFIVNNGTTVNGTGVRFWGTANHDLFERMSNGQLQAWEFNASGKVVFGAGLTTSGGSVMQIDNGTTVVGSSANFWGYGNRNVFLRLSSGQITAWEYNSSGVELYSASLTTGGSAFLLDNGTTILGTGVNFGGTSGHDIFTRNSSGQISAFEFNGSGATTYAVALTTGGSAFLLDNGTTIIGTGVNFGGGAGRDIFTRSSSGQIRAFEFNGSGATTYAVALTTGGSSFLLDNGNTIIGTGVNFGGTSGHDIFTRNSAGQISAFEFNGSGATTYAASLTTSGSAFLLDNGNTIIGTGVNFGGAGGHDMFTRNSSGQISAFEFNGSGATNYAVALTTGGSAFTLDNGNTIIGTGVNFGGTGGHDIFVRSSSGQISAYEFNSSGASAYTVALTTGGSAFLRDNGNTVIGTGVNFGGTGGHNMFIRNSAGQISAFEFDGAGAKSYSVGLTSGGSALVLDNGNTVIGTGTNFGGKGGHNMFTRNSAGQISAYEFNASGAANYTTALTTGGSAFLLDNGNTIIGTGFNFGGTGGHDVFTRNSSGQISAFEFNGSGATTYAAALTTGGSAFLLDNGTTVIGTGANFGGTGGRDMFLRNASGQLIAWEFNGSGASTYAVGLTTNGSSAFTVDNATQVLGVGIDQANSNKDIILQSGTGQTTVYDLSSNNILAAVSGTSTTLTSSNAKIVVATSGNETLTGPGGVSTLVGNGGTDVYQFGPSDTNETIINGLSTNGSASGQLEFTSSSLSNTNLWFERVDHSGSVSATGNNLRIDVLGTTQSATIQNWYASTNNSAQLSSIELTSSALLIDTQINNLVQAMATFAADYASGHGGAAFDPTASGNSTITDSTVLAAVNSAWHS